MGQSRGGCQLPGQPRLLRVWLWLDTAYLASPAELVGGNVWKE